MRRRKRRRRKKRTRRGRRRKKRTRTGGQPTETSRGYQSIGSQCAILYCIRYNGTGRPSPVPIPYIKRTPTGYRTGALGDIEFTYLSHCL